MEVQKEGKSLLTHNLNGFGTDSEVLPIGQHIKPSLCNVDLIVLAFVEALDCFSLLAVFMSVAVLQSGRRFQIGVPAQSKQRSNHIWIFTFFTPRLPVTGISLMASTLTLQMEVFPLQWAPLLQSLV